MNHESICDPPMKGYRHEPNRWRQIGNILGAADHMSAGIGLRADQWRVGMGCCWTERAHMAAVGAMLNDASLIADAKQYFKEHLMFGFFADGTPSEFERGIEDGAPTNGWWYSGAMIGDLVMIADVLARWGDTELYTYSTSDGLSGGPSPTTGGPKSLSLVIDHYLKYVVPSITRYGTGSDESGAVQTPGF